jgi:hypothetical protein
MALGVLGVGHDDAALSPFPSHDLAKTAVASLPVGFVSLL